MTERWTQMLETLRAQFSADSNVVELESFLAEKGLDRHEIGEVLTLYFADVVSAAFLLSETVPMVPSRGSLRVQGPHERGRFTVDAWGYLLLLHESGVVSEFDFEQLIERALFHIEGRIELPEIRALANEVGLDAISVSPDRPMLH